jgi:hypothetical protein
MFDVVPSQQHKLTLPVEIESVDDAKARLPRPPVCSGADARTK